MSYINFNNIHLTEVCNRLGLPIIKHGYGGNYKVKNYGGLIIKDSYFYQHSTGEKGGVIKFVMLTEGCSYQAAIELVKELFKDDVYLFHLSGITIIKLLITLNPDVYQGI